MNNSDMPAYPVTDEKAPPSEFGWVCGLTKRELIAAMAMQGYCANSTDGFLKRSSDAEVAEMSVNAADALLAELEKK